MGVYVVLYIHVEADCISFKWSLYFSAIVLKSFYDPDHRRSGKYREFRIIYITGYFLLHIYIVLRYEYNIKRLRSETALLH